MELTCANSDPVANVTESDIKSAFDDDSGRGEFIILDQSEIGFMQASGKDEGPYTLEYQQDSTDEHFQCPNDLSKTQVKTAFLKYLSNNTSWQSDHQWKKLEQKPWWKLW